MVIEANHHRTKSRKKLKSKRGDGSDLEEQREIWETVMDLGGGDHPGRHGRARRRGDRCCWRASLQIDEEPVVLEQIKAILEMDRRLRARDSPEQRRIGLEAIETLATTG